MTLETNQSEPSCAAKGSQAPASQVADRISSWMAGPQPSWAIVSWLEGYNLPAVGFDEDPSVWIQRGLDELTADTRRHFMERLARFVDERPDVGRPGDRPDEVLYNLLFLCKDLGDRDHLGPPLGRMYERAKAGEGLSGKSFRGVDLRHPLRLAICSNQHDRSLVSVWFDMLETGKEESLLGNEYSGFQGILAADRPGEPNLDDLGRALSIMVTRLGRSSERREAKLSQVISDIYNKHPDHHVIFDRFFLNQAMSDRWPDWATRCLHRRWAAQPGENTIVAWHSIWKELPEEVRSKEPEFIGNFVRIEVAPTEFSLIDSVGRGFDELLQSNPYKSQRSILGILNLTLIDLELQFESSEPEAAEFIRKARILLRSRLGQSAVGKLGKGISDIPQRRIPPPPIEDSGFLTTLYEDPTRAVAFCSEVVTWVFGAPSF